MHNDIFPPLCFTGKFRLSLDITSSPFPALHFTMMMYRVLGTSGRSTVYSYCSETSVAGCRAAPRPDRVLEKLVSPFLCLAWRTCHSSHWCTDTPRSTRPAPSCLQPDKGKPQKSPFRANAKQGERAKKRLVEWKINTGKKN